MTGYSDTLLIMTLLAIPKGVTVSEDVCIHSHSTPLLLISTHMSIVMKRKASTRIKGKTVYPLMEVGSSFPKCTKQLNIKAVFVSYSYKNDTALQISGKYYNT